MASRRAFSSCVRAASAARRVDFRSDTLTLPTREMKDAILHAPLGDDVYREDETVKELERRGALLLGKEAAIFVPSGTMGNLLAVGAHCARGSEVICGDRSHLFNYEAGGAGVIMSVSLNPLKNEKDGTLNIKAIQGAIRPDDPHYSRTGLVALENTHNVSGGTVLPLSYLEEVSKLCRKAELPLHLDGARLMNAVIALGLTPAEVAAPVDSVSLCLSKGLGAPVGSLLIGSEKVIAAARRLRKMVGGGMRQAGVIAAPALYALENNIERLAVDHANAKKIAQGLCSAVKKVAGSHEKSKLDKDGLLLHANDLFTINNPQTNIVNVVFERQKVAADFSRLLREHNIIAGGGYTPCIIRLVTHLNMATEDIERTVSVFETVVTQLFATWRK